MLRGSS
ncbi:hypothetical protein SOVF_160200, partial [Spinacia oleracea]